VAHPPPDVLSAGPGGLAVRFVSPSTQDETIAVVDRPLPLPAIAAAPLTNGRTGLFSGVGLDGSALPIKVIAAAAAVPSAPAGGLILDRRYAELAANYNMPQVNEQVWLAAGALRLITARLAAEGVRVLSAQTTEAQAALLSRQGPGLASVLFLADAAAVALLAACAAILALYLSARRRRYEYAALAATGVARRTLRGALLTEQLIVLGFGTLVGICAGLGAAFLVIRSVPEFITQPSAPPLVYVPSAGPLAALLGVAVAVLLVAAVTASGTLAHGVDLDQLREAPA
jgi:putative ABC transport system permease protein